MKATKTQTTKKLTAKQLSAKRSAAAKKGAATRKKALAEKAKAEKLAKKALKDAEIAKKKAIKSPYKRGNYKTLFDFIKKNQIVTTSEVVAKAMKLKSTSGKNKGKPLSLKAATATAIVLLSPRKVDGRGDCRGNSSAKGEYYYMEVLKNKTEDNEKRYRLRYRSEILPSRKRSAIKEIHQEVSEKQEKVISGQSEHTAVDSEQVEV